MLVPTGRTGVLVVGTAGVDLVIRPGPGAFGVRPSICLGGGARNIASNVRSLGCQVWFAGCVGADTFGRWIIHDTASRGIHARILLVRNARTPVFTALLDRSGDVKGTWIDGIDIFSRKGARVTKNMSWIPKRAIGVAIVSTDLSDMMFADIALWARRNRVLLVGSVVGDAGGAKVAGWLERLDYVFLNSSELSSASGQQSSAPLRRRDMAARLNMMVRKGPRGIVCTMGKEGVAARFKDNPRVYFRAAATALHARSAIGCGDALLSGVIVGLVRGLAPDAALGLGLHAARVSMESWDSAPLALGRVQVPRIDGA